MRCGAAVGRATGVREDVALRVERGTGLESGGAESLNIEMEAGLQRAVTGHCVMFARFFVEVDTDVAPLE